MWFVVSSILSGKRLVKFAPEASCVRNYVVLDQPALAIGFMSGTTNEGQLTVFRFALKQLQDFPGMHMDTL